MAAVLACAIVGAPCAFTPDARFEDRSARAATSPRTILLNQKRLRIEQLVRMVGEANERTILLPDDVRGTISIVSRRPATAGEAWRVLESALAILGFSLLPSTAGTWRVAKVADAVAESPFDPEASLQGEGDSFITTLISLQQASTEVILPILEPLAGGRVTLVPYPETNSLIASGPERAIARLTEIAAELDRVEEKRLRIRVLRYRGVEDVEALVEGFLEEAPRRVAQTQIWSDVRTNSLVVRGMPEGLEAVLDFLDRLDQPREGGGAIRILPVLNRDPQEVADLIQTLTDSGNASTVAEVEAGSPLDGTDFSIAVDGPSRSLIVRADPQTHETIRDLVEQLDASPKLVAVDITVSELRTPSAFGMLVGFQIPFSKGSGVGDVIGIVSSSPSAGNLPPTVTGRVQRDDNVVFIPDGSTTPVSIPIEVTFAGTDIDATNEVLIQPSLIVTAGEQHEIFAGDNIPIPVTEDGGLAESAGNSTGDSETNNGSVLNTLSRTTRFERRDIGTRLSVEVQAGEEGSIRLDLQLELSRLDLARASLGGDPAEVGPSFVENELTVTAMLEDGESAVLAVDQRTIETNLRSGVPFLRDLPYLGFLFGSDGKTIDDVRLMVVARARRVSNPAELVADTIRRRLAFERRRVRSAGLPAVTGSPFAVRVTTRRRADDAESIRDSLVLRGLDSEIHRWELDDEAFYDVYVTGLPSMVDAADLARSLDEDGWSTDLVVFPQAR
jgi:general secretion pathway protein D